ncbi:MAG: RNB domain-containing ribonuclease [Spirochaetaceae bacterium]|jgi:exoribonuclease-2|nr:RNB domain-containing ribonuclease [Spirochaetaceae bacterium]
MKLSNLLIHNLVVYKNRPAIISNIGDKISLALPGGEEVRVREKDIELIYDGTVSSLSQLDRPPPKEDAIREAWELLSGEADTQNLQNLAELISGEWSPASAWQAFKVLQENTYFSGDINKIIPKSREEIEAVDKKRVEKQQEETLRKEFLEKIKRGEKLTTEDLNGPCAKYIQDVEALARGQSEKSRTLKELHKSETPEEAHHVLLSTGLWTPYTNPYPARFACSTRSAQSPIPDSQTGDATSTERKDLTELTSYAIDAAYSVDPDDAVSVVCNKDGTYNLYIHVADPAEYVLPDSPPDIEARERGATLYLPEGAYRMLTEDAIGRFALGLHSDGISNAMTFELCLDSKGAIIKTDVYLSVVKVTRISYGDADKELSKDNSLSSVRADNYPPLQTLMQIAETNYQRRLQNGAINIDFPDIHIKVINTSEHKEVSISAEPAYRSNMLVRECMLLAGMAAIDFANKHNIAFPYVTQEAADLPNNPLEGYAGAFQLRKCMRPKQLSTRPARHDGLGLSAYTQVTSPLRRYIDLLAHQQIRAALGSGTYKDREPLSNDQLLLRLVEGEQAANAANQAERSSKMHWTCVYLQDKIDEHFDAVVLDTRPPFRGSREKAHVLIPSLGLETDILAAKGLSPNDEITLQLKSIRLPELETSFSII